MTYVIAGAGPAGVIAAETLRKTNPNSEISICSTQGATKCYIMVVPQYNVYVHVDSQISIQL